MKDYFGGGVQTGASVSAPAILQKESESKIRNTVCFSEEILAFIHGTIDQLESRLSTVLTPVPPSGESGNTSKDAMAISSHFHGRMITMAETLNTINSRLQNLINRVEV